MADSVKDLVVRLSFQHGDTRSQISSIKNELKLLDSEFRLAAAGAGGLSTGMNKSAVQAGQLEQKLNLQRQAVEKYETALKEAQTRIAETTKRHEEYGRRLQEAREKSEACKETIAGYKEELKALAKAGQEDTDQYREKSAALKEADEAYAKLSKEIKDLEAGYIRSDQSIANADKTMQKLTAETNDARAAQAQMEAELERLNQRVKNHSDALEAASARMTAYSAAATAAGNRQAELGRTMTKGTTAIIAAGTAAAGAAVSWESSFAGVRKTVNGTAEELANLEQTLLDMGEVKPASYSDLAGIAASAGQLGIATENVAAFTGVMADLAETTDLTADAAATCFAQYANITRMPQQYISNLGSVTVDLGNNLATTESKIVDFATGIAAAGSQAGMTDAQIFGLAAGLSSLGLEAQAGGTAFSRAISAMQVAVETGSDGLQAYADVAGMTAEQFARAFREDASGAFIQFVQGLSSGSQSAIVMLDELGITETRLRDTLLRASNASDLLISSVDMANSAWAKNTALSSEAAVRYGTTASRMQMMGNRAQRVAIDFGNSLLPALEDGLEVVDNLVDKFAALDEGQRSQILTWGAYAAAAGPTITLIGKANQAIGGLTGGLAKLFAAAAKGGSLTDVLRSVSGLLGPAGIAALAAGAGLVAYKFYDWASGAQAAREAVEGLKKAASELMEVQATTLYDTGNADPLTRFGLNREQFSAAANDAQDWIDSLLDVWTDGERETDAQAAQFADSFAAASDGVREKIQARGGLLDGLGALSDGEKDRMAADMKQLDAWDAEIEALLKKRQGGFLTEDEQARLNDVIRLRAELELSYSAGDGSGYQSILGGMQAEIDRMLAAGTEADASVYGDALNALAEGRQAYNESLAESYDAQHAQIMAIEDEATRTAALAALNEQYNARRLEGEQAYQQAVQQAASAAWVNGGYMDQVEQIDALAQMLGSGDIDMTALTDWVNNMDEGRMASMLALLEQLRASGADESQLAALGVDADDLLSKLQQIKDAAAQAEQLEGVAQIIGEAIPQEVQRVLVGLDMTEAAADWENFMTDKQSFESSGTVNIRVNPLDQAAIDAWEKANAVELAGPFAKVGVALGADWESDIQTALDNGMLNIYTGDGVSVPVSPEVLEMLSGNDLIALDEDGTYHVVITPEVGSTASIEMATAAMNSSPLDGTILSFMGSSTNDRISRIKETADEIANLQAQIMELNKSGSEWTEDGLGLNALQEMENSNLSYLVEQLSTLSETDLQAIADQAANLMAALTSGELDPETAEGYLTQLQTILDTVSAADQYLGEGNQISAGIAQGMAAYGWAGDAETVADSIRTAIDSALGIASPAKAMNPTGENTCAGIAAGMMQYSFSDAAAQVSGGIVTKFSGLGASGRSIGAAFGQGLYNGLKSKMAGTLALAKAYAAKITRTFTDAWEIHSPSRVAEHLTSMFGAGLEKGMLDWPTVSERMLDEDILGAQRRMGGMIAHSTDSRDFSVNSTINVERLEVRDEQDIRALAIEINELTRRDQHGRGIRT